MRYSLFTHTAKEGNKVFLIIIIKLGCENLTTNRFTYISSLERERESVDRGLKIIQNPVDHEDLAACSFDPPRFDVGRISPCGTYKERESLVTFSTRIVDTELYISSCLSVFRLGHPVQAPATHFNLVSATELSIISYFFNFRFEASCSPPKFRTIDLLFVIFLYLTKL